MDWPAYYFSLCMDGQRAAIAAKGGRIWNAEEAIQIDRPQTQVPTCGILSLFVVECVNILCMCV